MVSASALAWPLWAAGFAVAIIVYIALGYLLWRGVRLMVTGAGQARRATRLRRRAALYDGEIHPTLLDVAVSRADLRPTRERHGERPAA